MAYNIKGSIKVEDSKTFILKERMQDIVSGYDGECADDWSEWANELAKIIVNDIEGTSRWSVHHRCVFKLHGKYYATEYSEAATEIQDEKPYEYEGEWVEVSEVVPKEVTTIQYVPKEKNK